MALKESALNIVIRAKDLTKGVFKKTADEIEDVDDQSTKAATGGLVKLAKAAGAAVAAFASFATIKAGITAVLSTGDKFEKLGLQMTAIMGSLESGEQATAWIKDFAQETPLQLEEVTQAFITLKNFGLDPQDGTLQAIVDQNEKLGGGYERLIGITNALGQAQAKQKLQGEEILQLIERGVPVWQLLADVTGKSTAELNKMSSEGKIGTDVIAKLIEAMGASSTGAAAANMSTLSGLTSNLKDTWTNFLDTVAKSGALEYVKNELSKLSAAVKEMAENGQLQVWAQTASDAIVSLFSGLKTLAVGLSNASGAIVLFGQAWIAAKIVAMPGQILGIATALSTNLVGGATKATTAIRGLAKGFLALGVYNFVVQVKDLVESLGELSRAEKALAETQNDGLGVHELAAQRMQQLADDTGIAVSSIREMNQMIEAGTLVMDTANGKWIAGAEAVAAYKKETEEIVDTLREVNQVMTDEMVAAIGEGVEAFDKLAGKGKLANQALKTTLGKYDLSVTQDVATLIGVLSELESQGKISGEVIQEELGGALRKLSTDELVKFRIAARYAFDSGATGAQELADVLDTTVSAALQNMGVDIELAETGISQLGRTAIDQFTFIAKNIEDSGDSADVAAKKIIAAYEQAFQAVKTKAGKAELLAGLRKELEKGTITGAQFAAALKATGDEADKDSAKVQNLTEKVRELRQEMQEGAGDGQKLGEGIKAGAETGASAAGLITGAVEGYTNQMAALGQGARQAFEEVALGMGPAQTESERLQQRLQDVELELAGIEQAGLRLADTSGLQGALRGLRQNAREVEEAFLGQKIAAVQLFEEYENGSLRADVFIDKAQKMVKNSELLDDQDLSNLTRGIEAARQAMDRLNASTQNTLTSLQNELSRAQGDIEAVEERNYQKRVTDLEAKLAEAKYFKNEQAIEDLEQSLAIASDVYRIEKRNRAEAAAERRERDLERDRAAAKSQAEKSQASTTSQDRQNTSNQQTIILQAGNQKISVSTEDPSGLLDLLAAAGLRTS